MAKHVVLKNVLHGEGKNKPKVYRKGETLDLAPEDAKPLIAAGHLAAPEDKATK